MSRNVSLLLCASLLMVAFSACNSMPEHARYIPKDAVIVAGLNTEKIGKQIAWNAIIGSKLFDEMKTDLPQKTAMEGLGDAGIKSMSTSYLYVKTGKQYNNGARITALVPLDDVARWEAYVRKTFPEAEIKAVGARKETRLAAGMYAGWTDDLLIVLNIIEGSQVITELNEGGSDTTAPAGVDISVTVQNDSMGAESLQPAPVFIADEARLSAEMQQAFTLPEDEGITRDKRFKELETRGHDITFWINYDVLMSENGDRMGMPPELALGNSLWKDAAMAAGFDFEKGKITGDILYYTSDGLKEIAKELGGTDVDKELLDRLPAQDLNLLMGFHIAPKGIKSGLEKIGILGFANLALSAEGLGTDDIFEAFTGDIGMSLNGLKVRYGGEPVAGADSSAAGYNGNMTNMNFLYVMKIGNKDKFNKLLSYLTAKELLKRSENNIYRSPLNDSLCLVVGESYMVISGNANQAQSFLAGKFKGQPLPQVARQEVYGHPMGAYINMKTMLGSVEIGQGTDHTDSVALTESKRLLDNIVFNGGDFNGSAFRYHFALNFVDREENSIFQIMNFALKLNEANEREKQRAGRISVLTPVLPSQKYWKTN